MKIKRNDKLSNQLDDILYGMGVHLRLMAPSTFDVEFSFDEWLDYLDKYAGFVDKLDDWLLDLKRYKRECNKS